MTTARCRSADPGCRPVFGAVPNRARAARSGLASLATLAILALGAPRASADPLSLPQFGELALRCGPSVAPSTLASVARTESRFESLSINDNTAHTSGVPATLDIAVQVASTLLEAGHSLDLGLMQINSANFNRLGLTPASAFDPCRSIAAAAAILSGSYAGGETHDEQQAAVRRALSRYNTGDAERGFANGYVHKVELAARAIVPALDVGTAPAASERAHPPAAAAPDPKSVSVPAPVDPAAPPSWDVWASSDDAPASPPGSPPAAAPEAAATILVGGTNGPASPQPVSPKGNP